MSHNALVRTTLLLPSVAFSLFCCQRSADFALLVHGVSFTESFLQNGV